ncbi:hypothetical protein APHAL10511_003381 [Amanita phalloides]|nr:hypothetical protein APHAL10511_003381 [Amanita phalloides]
MRTYEIVPGFFVQDDCDPATLPAIPPRFGLRDNSDQRWATLIDHLKSLNESAHPGTSYILFFLGRHGQGYHNVGYEKYGMNAWDEYWSKLNTDGEIRWGPDAELTQLGLDQARGARDAWRAERAFGIPLPDRMYCSPLTRALRTHEITFGDAIPARKTLVLEMCREENGVHTCDKRRTRTYIHEMFPLYEIEQGLTEEDELWSPDVRESTNELVVRARRVLDTVFGDAEKEGPGVVAITAHAGFIRAFMRALGRVTGDLHTGGVLPVVVKSSTVRALN